MYKDAISSVYDVAFSHLSAHPHCSQKKRNARASMSGFFDCDEAPKINGQNMSQVMSPATKVTPMKTPSKSNESNSIIDWLSQALAPNNPQSQAILVDGPFLVAQVRRCGY
jgi:hypothetical protein